MMNILTYLFQQLLEIFFRIYFFLNKNFKPSESLMKAVKLYQNDGFGEIFAKIRAWDAPLELVDAKIPKGATVLDLGCGDGLLANFLGISSSRRKVKGIELNPRRAGKADKGIPNVSFESGNILTASLPSSKVTLLVHVLHHLPSFDDQVKLLDKILKNMRKGQMLIILEIDKKPFLKYVFSWLTDAITVPILFEQKIFTTKFYYRSLKKWKGFFKGKDVAVRTSVVNKGMPFSHILITVEKK